MNRKFRLILILTTGVVAGCQSGLPFDQLDSTQQAGLLEQYRDDCKAFGFRRGTNAFAKCVQTAVVERDRELNLRRAIALENARVCQRRGLPYGGCY